MEMLMSGRKSKKFSGFLNSGSEEKDDLFELLSIENKAMTVKKTFMKEYLDLNNGMINVNA